MIGDRIRAYAEGRADRLAGRPPRSGVYRPTVREYYRLGWREGRLEQLDLFKAPGKKPDPIVPTRLTTLDVGW